MTDERQAARRDYIVGLMDDNAATRNQIAAISGLSNPYIKELESGRIANVGREKLLSLAIALDLNLTEIDHMLTLFDRASLTSEDIATFIQASARCRISAALHPVHDSFTFDLMLLSAELIPGAHAIVSSRPASCLRSEGHRLYAEKTLVAAHPLYGDLITAINKERRQQLMLNLNRHPVENYVCLHCLQDYLRQCDDPLELKWRVQHIRNSINMISGYENFRFFITSECPSFIFVLRSPVRTDTAAETEKLVITVLPPHRIQVRSSGLLAGFATDSKAVIQNFKKELQYIKKTVMSDYLQRPKLIAFLESLIKKAPL